jgi:hypothetical protein
VREFAFSNDASGSSTYTATYSSLERGGDSDTQTLSHVQSLGTGGTIASGQDFDPLTSVGTSTLTYSESGARTISWGAGNYDQGSYSETETASDSASLSDYASLSIGAGGTITAGIDTSVTTQTISDSQPTSETGTESVVDPEGGPGFGGAVTQSSVTTSYISSVNNGTQTLGAYGAITGGGNCFTFIEQDSNSLSLTANRSSGDVSQDDTASFSEIMVGTETYGAGGVITGGSDFYTWIQSGLDNDTYYQSQGGSTLTVYTEYTISINDSISDSLSDRGTDILRGSDSIVGGSDTYTDVQARALHSSVGDSGTSGSPISISAQGSDQFSLSDTGSSTLTTAGHVYAMDVYCYTESSSDSASDSQSENGQINVGAASDTYSDNDYGTMNVTDTVTTSVDSFTLRDSHSISGSDQYTTSNSSTVWMSSPFAYSDASSNTDEYVYSGPPSSTVTVEQTGSTTESGGDPVNLTETLAAGHGDASGGTVARNLGSFPEGANGPGGAVHDGTSQPVLDVSEGLVSAIGGQDVHGLEFVGAAIAPVQASSGMILEEPNQSNPGTGNFASWVSHPSAIGYRRAETASVTSPSTDAPAVSPEMDSGMANGSSGDELARLASFYTGAEENPTSAQSAPTPRAQQSLIGLSTLVDGDPLFTPTPFIQPDADGPAPIQTTPFNPETGVVNRLQPIGSMPKRLGNNGNMALNSLLLVNPYDSLASDPGVPDSHLSAVCACR